MTWKIHIFNADTKRKLFSTGWIPAEEMGATLLVLNKPSMFGQPCFKILLEPFDVTKVF